ncbi:hypothetical protein N781_14550 [Pontibacillus halophilus JSM 076056 = DSM 19796]|uniref:Uncharacterized protein n=1 Tax=Pontibacillus halophilus JSM 076056 = DSM 19796 TaxID=1385510 RepID=A0A0A5GNM3_9BACI|nr:hypothetical protein [Pontibacillus halophilus]KGX92770.1 hypothetical protein N781_14550 [Pontibacillus halophilus JSM 076056 = DSM 19796]
MVYETKIRQEVLDRMTGSEQNYSEFHPIANYSLVVASILLIVFGVF